MGARDEREREEWRDAIESVIRKVRSSFLVFENSRNVLVHPQHPVTLNPALAVESACRAQFHDGLVSPPAYPWNLVSSCLPTVNSPIVRAVLRSRAGVETTPMSSRNYGCITT